MSNKLGNARGRTMVEISRFTHLALVDGEPTRLFSTSRDLDAAFDKACHHVGESLDCGEWSAWLGGEVDGVEAPSSLKGRVYSASVGRAEGV